jgi:L-methionine (R)-S-oxide reductase
MYEKIKSEWNSICEGNIPWETKVSTLIALVKTHNPAVSWVGTYLNIYDDGSLWVTSYQGPIACTNIPPGRGVCGQSFLKREVIIVPNVHEFAGHIACDSKAQSEIVLPLTREKKLVGVLDLDSHSLAAFDETDAKYLEAFLSSL